MEIKLVIAFTGIIILSSFFISTNLLVASNGSGVYKTIVINVKSEVNDTSKNITSTETTYYFDKFIVYKFSDYFVNTTSFDQIASDGPNYERIETKLTNNYRFTSNRRDSERFYDTTIYSYHHNSPLKKFFTSLNYLNKACIFFRFVPLFFYFKKSNFMYTFNYYSDRDKRKRKIINICLMISYSILCILMYISFFIMMNSPNAFKNQNLIYHNKVQNYNDILCDGLYQNNQYYYKCVSHIGESKIKLKENDLYLVKWYPETFWVFSIISAVLDTIGLGMSIYFYFSNDPNLSINPDQELEHIQRTGVRDLNIEIKNDDFLNEHKNDQS